MIELSPIVISFVFLTFVLAGMVKGVTGMGLPTVAMGLLATTLKPAEAASLLFLPTVLTNAWQLATGPDPRGAIRRFWPMMSAVALGAVATAGLLTGGSAHYATAALGVVLVVYGAYGLSGRRLAAPARSERWLAPVIGLTTGALTGGTGVSVMPVAPYLQSLGLDKEDLVQALGLAFTVSTLALGLGLALNGAFAVPALAGSAAAFVPAAIGMAAGQWLRLRISQKAFRAVFFAGIGCLGAYLAVEALVVPHDRPRAEASISPDNRA